MMKIKWKPVIGYEKRYEVSNTGIVRTIEGKIMKQRLVKGYLALNLSQNGKRKLWYVHRLVLLAHGKLVPGKNIVNHIDGNKLNNNIKNLEWCTIAENNKHAIEHNLRSDNLELFIPYRESRKHMIQASKDGAVIATAKGPKRLAQELIRLGYFDQNRSPAQMASNISHAALYNKKYHGFSVEYL